MDTTTFENMAKELRLLAEKSSRALLADDADAEDVAQDVMVRLWNMRGELRSDKIRGLVSLMARRMSLNVLRRKQQEGYATVAEELVDNISPFERLQEMEMATWLDRRLQRLPSTQRTVLRMRQVEHRSRAEIAKKLGIEIHTVETLLSRARHDLLNEIKKELL